MVDLMELEDCCRKVTASPTVQLPTYSFKIKYLDMDFLNCSMPLVLTATANCSFSSGLTACLERETKSREFIFMERKGVGEVAVLPRYASQSRRRIYYMMLKSRETDIPRFEDMRSCVWCLFNAACEYDEPCLAIPVVDKWRDPIPWQMWYDVVHRNRHPCLLPLLPNIPLSSTQTPQVHEAALNLSVCLV